MVWSASFSPDGKSLAMASYHSGDVVVYDAATWQPTATLEGEGSSVFAVAFSPRGDWLAAARDTGLQLWRAGHYEAPAAQARTTGMVWSIGFQPDGSGFVTAGQKLQAWRIEPGDGETTRLEAGVVQAIDAHTVLPVSGRPCFASAAPDTVRLHCDDSLAEVLRVPVPSSAAAVSPDGRWLFNEQYDGMLAAWPLDGGADAFRIPLGAPVRSMTGSDRWLAAGTDGGEVAIFGLDPWKERMRLRLAAAPVEQVTASADGRWLAVSQGASLHVFDSGNWREVASGTYGDDVGRTAFAAGDRWLVAVAGPTVIVRQAGDWRERRLAHDGTIERVRVDPGGRRLATITHWNAGHDSGVSLTRVFELASGKETGWQYTSGSGNISAQAMRDEAARRKRALAGGDTASVQAASSWPELALTPLRERTSADGLWEVRLSGRVATLRDVAAKRNIAGFAHGAEITGVRFVPSLAPRWLVSAGEDGTLAAWPLRTDDLSRDTCARLRALFDPQALAKLIAEADAEGSCEGK